MFVRLGVSIKTHKRDHLTSACMILWFRHNYNNTVGWKPSFCSVPSFCVNSVTTSRGRNVFNTGVTNINMHDVCALSKFQGISAVLIQGAPNRIEDLSPKVECLLVSYCY